MTREEILQIMGKVEEVKSRNTAAGRKNGQGLQDLERVVKFVIELMDENDMLRVAKRDIEHNVQGLEIEIAHLSRSREETKE